MENGSDNIEPLLHPKDYHMYFVESGARSDGRKFDSFRSTNLQLNVVSTANGSALCQQGATRVLSVVKGELCDPDIEHPGEGLVAVSFNVASGVADKALLDEIACLNSTLTDIFNKNVIFPLDELCIERGRLVWVLYVDVMVLDYDGNLADPMMVCLMGALSCTTLPRINISMEEKVQVVEPESEVQPIVPRTAEVIGRDTPMEIVPDFTESIRLRLSGFVFGVTFVLLITDDSAAATSSGVSILVDPTSDEAKLFSNIVSVFLDDEKRVVSFSKHGGIPLNTKMMDRCIAIAKQRSDFVRQLVKKAA